MKIRKATIEDVNIIAKYNYNLALETEEKVLNMDTVTKGVEAILRDSTKGIYHVCEIEGQVVGQIMYTFEWSDWRNGTFLWIQSVYVDKKFRGKGIFKNLYKYIKDNYADYLKGYLKKDVILRDAKNILSDVNYKKFVKYFDMYKDKI